MQSILSKIRGIKIQYWLAAVLALAVIVSFIPDKYQTSFIHEGIRYHHILSQLDRDTSSYYYTPDGAPLEQVNQYIRIVAVNVDIDTSRWLRLLSPLLHRYHLTPIEGDSLQLFGAFDLNDSKQYSYASTITIDGNEHLIILIMPFDDQPQLRRDSMEVLSRIVGLKSIESNFN